MKNFKKVILIIFLLIIYTYICNIEFLPNSYVLFEGEKLSINTIFGIDVKQISSTNINIEDPISEYRVIQTTNKLEDGTQNTGVLNLSLNLFNIPLKEIQVNVIPKTTVVPVGNVVGLKLYTNGVLVVGMSEIEGETGKRYKPYENTGILEGDLIISINEEQIDSTDELIEVVNKSNGNKLDVKYVRNGALYTTNIQPTKTTENDYKLGLWVRDTAAGVGTFTFYEPSTNMFAALGHGIIDIDTEEIVEISRGDIVTTNIIGIVKGEKGEPGEIKGTVENQKTIGKVYKNTQYGIYGMLINNNVLNINKSAEMEVALREEIKSGPAKIICTLENNKIEEYDIQIQKIYANNNHNNKSMLIKITDEKLLEKTGGIIQGMSGSPIIQNGKFIGAVTHVLVNDPTTGYGVFADLMIKQLRQTGQ